MSDLNRQINHQRAAQVGQANARAAALTPTEQIQISTEATQALYREAVASGRPIPDSQAVQRHRHNVLNAAIDKRLAGAT